MSATRRGLAVAAMTAAAFAAWSPAVASADGAGVLRVDDASSLLFGGGSGQEVAITRIPVRVRGDLAVEFHGDQATGCAARGLCGFSGTVVWQPPPTATLETDAFRQHGGTDYEVSLGFFEEESLNGAPIDGGVTTADVRFTPNGSAGSSSICTDAAATGANVDMPVHLRAASLTLAAATPSLLATRCAGPLQNDVAQQLARRVVDLATVLNGRSGVSLASSSNFAAHGLAGTVTSTVRLSLGSPHTERVQTGTPTPKGPSFRTVLLSYRARLDGSVNTHIHGDPASCAPLGSCGANGTFALRVHSKPGTLAIAALAPARRPLRDALTALGLRKDGNPRGIPVLGFFSARGSAAYAVDIIQGANTCRDTAPSRPGGIFLDVTRGRLDAHFEEAQQAPHLRCPGPTASPDNGPASGTAPIRRVARDGGTIHLRTGVEFTDDGYTVRTVPDLALTMSRPKMRIVNDALRSGAPG